MYPQQIPPVASPDATPSKVEQRTGSTLYNLVQSQYVDANGTNTYKFKSNEERMMYKYGKYRAQNVASGAFSNYPNYGQGTQ